jgi:hypothetical protein
MMQLSQSVPRVIGVIFLFFVALAVDERFAFAQSTPSALSNVFLGVNIGAQPKARDYTVSQTFPLYDETATVETLIGTGGKAIFDFGGGYRVWNGVSVGISFSFYKDQSSTTAMATIPDPLVFDSPHTSSFPLDVLDHSERGVHISIGYTLPLTFVDKLDVTVFAGPSFYTLKKDMPGAVTVVPGGSTLSNVAIEEFSGSGAGGHLGLDFNYMVTPMFGAGAFWRFAPASVDVPSVSGGKVDVGGQQIGFGGRVRF